MGTLDALRESANPYVWFRAFVMDLGFAGLIEEIEKRFGKMVTTIMLGMLFLGIVLWVLRMVVALFVEIDELWHSRDLGDLLLAMAYRLGFVFLIAALGIGWALRRLKKEQARIYADIAANMELRSDVDDLMTKVEARADEVAGQLDEMQRLRDEIRSQLGEG